MDIALVDLKRQYNTLKPEVDAALGSVLSGMQLFLGPNLRAFEREYATYLGVEDCVGVGDGTAALYLALRACGVGPGDEVITVSHTFFATVGAIAQVGARPVFVDIDPETMTMKVDEMERAITPRTRAIIPVHLYGRMADMPAIMAAARRHEIPVIEDACQAHGARRDGTMAGTFGDVGCFSFYYSKNLGAYGEAGAVTTSDPELKRRLQVLRDHGSEQRYHHIEYGFNARMDEIQAAILRIKLPHLEAWNERRRAHAARYAELLADAGLDLPSVGAHRSHVFYVYVVRSPERDRLQQQLADAGIGTGIHFPIPIHLQAACRDLGYGPGDLPVTEHVAKEVLSLPMYAELTDDQLVEVARVARSVRPALNTATA
jgi:dTDP-4-amino-4,6-dideoxygalactose transaminase